MISWLPAIFPTMRLILPITTSIVIAAAIAQADDASIEAASARATTTDVWTFSVTLRHGDTGWDDYADGWRVVLEDGTVLGTRTLFHPHVNEQPFTRSLSGVSVPKNVSEVFIEARTNTNGWGTERLEVPLNH